MRCPLKRLRGDQIDRMKIRKVRQQQRCRRDYFMKEVAVVSNAVERIGQGPEVTIGFSIKEVD